MSLGVGRRPVVDRYGQRGQPHDDGVAPWVELDAYHLAEAVLLVVATDQQQTVAHVNRCEHVFLLGAKRLLAHHLVLLAQSGVVLVMVIVPAFWSMKL